MIKSFTQMLNIINMQMIERSILYFGVCVFWEIWSIVSLQGTQLFSTLSSDVFSSKIVQPKLIDTSVTKKITFLTVNLWYFS